MSIRISDLRAERRTSVRARDSTTLDLYLKVSVEAPTPPPEDAGRTARSRRPRSARGSPSRAGVGVRRGSESTDGGRIPCRGDGIVTGASGGPLNQPFQARLGGGRGDLGDPGEDGVPGHLARLEPARPDRARVRGAAPDA